MNGDTSGWLKVSAIMEWESKVKEGIVSCIWGDSTEVDVDDDGWYVNKVYVGKGVEMKLRVVVK